METPRWMNHRKAFLLLGLVGFFFMLVMTPRSPAAFANRPTVYGKRGMVVSASVISSQVGRDILEKGGNAVDAAVAMAAVLGLTEPHLSGPLGVGYLLYYSPKGGAVKALEFGGRGPAAFRADAIADVKELESGPKSIAVPGNIAGWAMLLKEHGTMDLAQVFAPAIELAESGFPLTAALAATINGLLEKNPPPTTAAVYGKKDKTAWIYGDIFTNPAYGAMLRAVAQKGVKEIYGGKIGAAIVKTVRELGGFLTLDDLRNYQPEWMTPIHTTFRGYTVYTPPPPSTGIQVLETLNIIEGDDLKTMGFGSAPYLHLFMEAVNLAATDRNKYVGDPDFIQVPLNFLLSKENAATRRKLINAERAATSYPESMQEGTTHLAAADRWGNIVAITQTIGGLWGSRIVGDGSGSILNNAYEYANTKPEHPGCVAPHRRQAWCLSPCIILDKEGRFWASVGTPGGETIQQTQAQVIVNLIEFGMDPQEAVSVPRFAHTWMKPEGADPYTFGVLRTPIDHGFASEVYEELRTKGHNLALPKTGYGYTGSNAVIRFDRKSGWFLGGADPRRSLYAIGY